MLLFENTAMSYSSSYQRGLNDDNSNTVSTNNKSNANLPNNKNNVKYSESHQKHFVVCESCFWCATYLINNITSVSACPICDNAKVEFLPIANDLVD
jgi:rubrerythrin